VISAGLRRATGYPKLATDQLSVLVLDGRYHLHDECADALRALGHRVVAVEARPEVTSPARIVRELLVTVLRERPDFVLSINHIGFDDGGSIAEVCAEIGLPVAVWYVDSPMYVLRGAEVGAPDSTMVFLWELSWEGALRAHGARHVRHLPLAADPARFRVDPRRRAGAPTRPVVFVGDSMSEAKAKWRARVPAEQLPLVDDLAAELLSGTPVDVLHAERRGAPDLLAAATWTATATRRARVLGEAVPYGLTIHGDEGWAGVLAGAELRGPVAYGPDLAAVYASAPISLNATSVQMPTAVNQRVFDVPLAGGFVLSDAQSDLFRLFERGTEAVAYESAADVSHAVDHYLRHPDERAEIVRAARRRVLAEHTYERRIETMLAEMRDAFAPG